MQCVRGPQATPVAVSVIVPCIQTVKALVCPLDGNASLSMTWTRPVPSAMGIRPQICVNVIEGSQVGDGEVDVLADDQRVDHVAEAPSYDESVPCADESVPSPCAPVSCRVHRDQPWRVSCLSQATTFIRGVASTQALA